MLKWMAERGTRLMFLTIPYRHFAEGTTASEVCNVCYYIAENTQKVPALFRYEDCTLGKKERERCSGQQEPLELTDAVVGLDVTYYDADLEGTIPGRRRTHKVSCRAGCM